MTNPYDGLDELRAKLLHAIDEMDSAVAGRIQAIVRDTEGPIEVEPAGMRMPGSEAAQIYELRRMFRL